MDDFDEAKQVLKMIATIACVIVVFILIGLWFNPQYNVWNAGMSGQAELAQAQFNRQTKVVEAHANLEAQDYNAQSEVVRAKGLAQANNIVKDSIDDRYIRYLWVQTLDRTKNQIIYVPEGRDGLPIVEAGRGVK